MQETWKCFSLSLSVGNTFTLYHLIKSGKLYCPRYKVFFLNLWHISVLYFLAAVIHAKCESLKAKYVPHLVGRNMKTYFICFSVLISRVSHILTKFCICYFLFIHLFILVIYNETRYKCNICEKSYKHQHHLRRHQHGCGREKELCCPYCPYRTYRLDNLKGHVANKHQENVFWIPTTVNLQHWAKFVRLLITVT